jgi:hypothetical protein
MWAINVLKGADNKRPVDMKIKRPRLTKQTCLLYDYLISRATVDMGQRLLLTLIRYPLRSTNVFSSSSR